MIRQKKNSGFTLAELLIVVAIVGILVAISIPVFRFSLHNCIKRRLQRTKQTSEVTTRC